MNTKRKSFLTRAIAITLTVILMLTLVAAVCPLFVGAAEADDTYLTYPISDIDYAYDGYTPIPMIVIQTSFDADGDGVDDNPDGSGENAVKDKNSPSYGEQWCHTKDEEWIPILFSTEGASLRTYYEYVSGGNFYFYEAEENYGTPNDGIIHIVINGVHPAVKDQWLWFFNVGIQAASEYVDFSVFDKNKNGNIDTYELAICFILGGYESSSSAATITEVFGFHANYKSYDAQNSTVTDGVTVASPGRFGTGSISGGHALNFGVFAHELGHYLGAPDLYDASTGRKYDYAVGTLSLMAKGAHGASPAHPDAWNMLGFGFYDETVATNGEYTLYSKSSKEGEYNILKICTPNPNEYFLVENRYVPPTESGHFDGAATMRQGIVIYHVDELIYSKTGMTCNEAGDGYDPTIVAYGTSTKVAGALNPSAFGKGKTWQANYYEFPVSKTWYTNLTDEQAAAMQNLKIEVISDAGSEMKVKISGADYVPDMSWVASATNETTTSFTVAGKIKNLATATLNDFNITLKEKSSGKEISTQQIKVKADGSFAVDYTGLTQNTTYTYTITADTSRGEVKTETNAYTAVGEIVKTNYTVSAYRNLTDNDTSPRTIKVDLGKTLSYSFPMTRNGYAFVGWYLDPEFTKPFDLSFTQDEAVDFSIYAKWVPNAEAATLKLNGANAQNKIFSVLPGEKFIEPVIA
ncbi:MAG: InlB B-repeat-containing protein, partial [Clostridia bacterium]|nr:InlB B-repeat-containing protein [Clostridia bacterium]